MTPQEQAQPFIQEARLSLQSGQPEQALQFIDKALSLDMLNPEAKLVKAICLSSMGQQDAASQEFYDAMRLDPGNGKIIYNAAVHAYTSGKKSDAYVFAKRAQEIDPNNAQLNEWIGTLESELGVQRPPVPPSSLGLQPPFAPAAPQPFAQSNYVRDEYAGAIAPQAHTVDFVNKMGPRWTSAGWAIVAVKAVTIVLGLVVSFSMVSAIFGGLRPDVSPGAWAVTIFGYLASLLMLIWVGVDIADRKGNWLWFVVVFFGSACSFMGAVFTAIYILAGRNPVIEDRR